MHNCLELFPRFKRAFFFLTQISFVIIGGYGDLAKKYLWQGVHNLDETYGGLPKTPLLLYSSGRAAPEVIHSGVVYEIHF